MAKSRGEAVIDHGPSAIDGFHNAQSTCNTVLTRE